MNLATLAAWRDTGCPWRARSRELVAAQWAGYGLPITTAEPDPGPFNRSQAINRAARLAGGWDVALIIDLDVLISIGQIVSAIEHTHATGRAVVAFDTLRLIDRPRTARIHDGAPLRPVDGTPVDGHVSCAVAVTRDLWETVGGFDERFVGWGAEDRAFWAACKTLAGPGHRIPGPAYHLWHPYSPERDRRAPGWTANVILADRYRMAGAHFDGGYLRRTRQHADQLPTEPTPDAMCALLREPGGPLAPKEAP